MASIDMAELRRSLERRNEVFTTLIKRIPAKYYVVQEQNEEPQGKWAKNVKQKMPKQEVKESSKKGKRAKAAAGDVPVEEEALPKKPSNGPGAKDVKSKKKRKADEMGPDEDEDEEAPAPVPVAAPAAPPVPFAGSITDIRARLHERIAALQTKHKRQKASEPEEETEGEGGESMPSTKDELLEIRRRKRGEMRDKRRKETKERKARERSQKVERERTMGVGASTKLLVPEPNRRPQGDVSLSNVSFPSASLSKSARKHVAPSDPTVALSKLTAKSAALEKLDPEERKRREEAERYEKAEARIEGAKVHDDVGRLKKAAKRKDKEKKKSKDDWDKRKQEVHIQMAAKQKKRTDNLLARNERRKDKKMGVKPKAVKARPGFEGKPMPFAKRKMKAGKR